MRAFVLSTVVAGVALAAGCSDTPRTSQPIFATAGSGGGVVTGAGGATLAGATGGSASGGTAGSPAGGQAGRAAIGGAAGAPVFVGSGGAAGARAPLAPPAPRGLVSLNSDHRITSLSLLSPMGGSVNGSCVRSTSIATGTALTISGDAVLPSQPQLGGNIVIVDRGNGLLTFVDPDPAGCFVARQVAVPGGAKTSPHDVVILSEHRAYVTRYEASASSSQQQAGNDVVVIDPTTGTFIQRINLDMYAATGSGAGVLARPDRALIADGLVVVSLNQRDASLATFGTGAVVVIDPLTDTVLQRVSLPGLFGCEGMDFIPATHTLLVSCGGIDGDADQPLQSGLAVVDFSGPSPRLDHVVSSVALDAHPLNSSWVLAAPIPSSPQRAFAGTSDPNGAALDALYALDVASGLSVRVGTSSPFSLGIPALADDVLFVPEALASTPRVQRFLVSGAPQAVSEFTPDVADKLPPRQIAWY
jgi:hypothetical protein